MLSVEGAKRIRCTLGAARDNGHDGGTSLGALAWYNVVPQGRLGFAEGKEGEALLLIIWYAWTWPKQEGT